MSLALDNRHSDIIADEQLISVGKIGAPHGLDGWLKVFSHTNPVENISFYSRWFLKTAGHCDVWQVADKKPFKEGMLAKLQGCDDVDAARLLTHAEILVPRRELPMANEGEFYWVDLVGLTVVNKDGFELGKVKKMLQTGANDVMVVVGERRRLIPFVVEDIVLEVDFDEAQITVDWGLEF